MDLTLGWESRKEIGLVSHQHSILTHSFNTHSSLGMVNEKNLLFILCAFSLFTKKY